MKKNQYIVIGLGIFGSTIVKTLSEYGYEVLAIDKNPECVQRVAEYATNAVIGDATDQEFLLELGISDFDVGIVATGSHMESSMLTVLNLKELGIPMIVAKAKNKQYKTILEKVGADRVVRPEKEMGEKIARSLMRRNITDLIEIDEKYSIVEVNAFSSWVNKTIIELDLRKKYGINILGIRDQETQKLVLTIDPHHVIQAHDQFLIIADTTTIEKLDYQ